MIRESTRGPVRVLTIDRPRKKNALDRETAEALGAAVRRASEDLDIRGIVLAAIGDVFLAGGDLDEIARLSEDPSGADRILDVGRHLDAIETSAVPVYAAVTGDVYGGGCEVVLACDEVFAEPGVTFSLRHAVMGLCPAWGGTARLVDRIGRAQAARLLFTAEPITAEEATGLGFVSTLTGLGEALGAAEARIGAIARADRHVIATQRRLLRATAATAASRALEEEAFRELWGGPGHRAAMAAFARRKSGA